MLKTGDLQRTIVFYTTVLGFECGGVWPERSPSWCVLRKDEAEIMFYTDDEGHEPSPPKLTGTLYIRTEGVLELHAGIKDRVKVLWGPEVYHYGMHEFAIEDCNGYTLSFGQPTDAPPTHPED